MFNRAKEGLGMNIMCSQDKDADRVQYLRTVFDTMPLPAFIVDEDVRIHDFNSAAVEFLGPNPALALYRRGGEAFHCIHAGVNNCGGAEACKDCVIRNSVIKAMSGKATCREIHKAELRTRHGTTNIDLLITTSLLPYTDTPQALVILEDVSGTIRPGRPRTAESARA